MKILVIVLILLAALAFSTSFGFIVAHLIPRPFSLLLSGSVGFFIGWQAGKIIRDVVYS